LIMEDMAQRQAREIERFLAAKPLNPEEVGALKEAILVRNVFTFACEAISQQRPAWEATGQLGAEKKFMHTKC